MDSGTLRYRIDIDERVTSQDVYGDPVATWVPWKTDVPANIEDISGKEYLALLGAGIASQITTRITIRWIGGVLPTMRIRHLAEDGSPPLIHYYDIHALLRDKKTGRDELTIP